MVQLVDSVVSNFFVADAKTIELWKVSSNAAIVDPLGCAMVVSKEEGSCWGGTVGHGPAPIRLRMIQLVPGFRTSQVVMDLVYQQEHGNMF